MKFNNYKKCICKEKNTQCSIIINSNRDSLLSANSLDQFKKLYGASNIQEYFSLVASTFSQNCEHAQRMYDYMSQLYFMPSTAVLRYVAKLETLPIACFLNSLTDFTADGIIKNFSVLFKQMTTGGGTALEITTVKEKSENLKSITLVGGITSCIRAIEATGDILRGYNKRTATTAYYLSIDHPEIEEFICMRKPTFDFSKLRLSSSTNIGVKISNEFMKKVLNKESWDLISRHDGSVVKTISAFELWIKILTCRLETGEPYLFFDDNVKSNRSDIYKTLNISVTTSNLCTEILLPTNIDHLNNKRAGVCCLGSLNLELYDDWKNNDQIIEDCCLFLDNVLELFLSKESEYQHMKDCFYSVRRNRAIGLGVMGLNAYFQVRRISFESEEAIILNEEIFKHISEQAEKASLKLGQELGPCEDAKDVKSMHRFVDKLAVAPTTYLSTACNFTSAGINPFYSNYYIHKNIIGSKPVKNKLLVKYIKENYLEKEEEIWNNIRDNLGSVCNVSCFTDKEKAIFKTAFEIDMLSHIRLSSDRAKYICQGQSLNLFFMLGETKKKINTVHIEAWRQGIPTLYYLHNSPAMNTSNEGKTFDKLKSSIDENLSSCSNCES